MQKTLQNSLGKASLASACRASAVSVVSYGAALSAAERQNAWEQVRGSEIQWETLPFITVINDVPIKKCDFPWFSRVMLVYWKVKLK